MPVPEAITVELARRERKELEKLSRKATAPARSVQRARIILLAAAGLANAEIAREVGCHVDTVRKWRGRFAEAEGLEALDDRPRSGRPARVTPEIHCELIKLACDRPRDHREDRDRWTHEALAAALEEETGVRISRSEVGRILRNEDFRPHQVRPWLHSPDPDFRPKVRRICDLYLDPPPGAHVVCVDEKTSIQALARRYPGRPAAPGRAGRREFEYVRHGTCALLAAFDVRTGQVYGECRDQRRAVDLLEFMDNLARQYPRGPVYIIWDNLNIHCDGKDARWTEFNRRHGGRFHFVHTPLHASWVNQIEIWFSILQRRALRDGDFRSRDDLISAIEGFKKQWNRYEAHPFKWSFRGRFVHSSRRRPYAAPPRQAPADLRLAA